MKTIALAIFVETPGLSPIQTQLSQSLNQEDLKEFYLQSIRTIEEVISQVSSQMQDFKLIPYWAVAEEEGLTNNLWQNFNQILQPNTELSERFASIEDSLLELYDAVIFINANQPHIEPLRVQLVAEKALQNQFVLGPCHNGDYYLYSGGANLSFQEWKSITYSSDKTFSDFHKLLESRGHTHILPEDFCVETKEDLQKLSHYLTKFQSIPNKLLPEQKKLGHWLRAKL